jgi:hypothetical protein
MKGPFVGTKDSFTGDNGGLISAIELQYWDFETDSFSVPVQGYEYLQRACAALRSDPWPPSQDIEGSRLTHFPIVRASTIEARG